MHNLEDIQPRRSDGLDRRSFLRASAIIAVSAVAGSLSLPAIAQPVRFTPAEVKELSATVVRVPIHGARLPAMVLSLSGVEAPSKQR